MQCRATLDDAGAPVKPEPPTVAFSRRLNVTVIITQTSKTTASPAEDVAERRLPIDSNVIVNGRHNAGILMTEAHVGGICICRVIRRSRRVVTLNGEAP
ncbi:hypothetical protein KM043_008503 [Ampulex compressa]|nr:hypothetical protein KM043_008503 [Ampulex compressa]